MAQSSEDLPNLPAPEYKIVEIETEEGEKGLGCPHCRTLLPNGPEECCVGQSYEMLRSRVVKIADMLRAAESEEAGAAALDAFDALAEDCR